MLVKAWFLKKKKKSEFPEGRHLVFNQVKK